MPEVDAEQEDGWFSEATATLGDRLAAAREAAGMTQDDLARRLGVRLATLRNWENDAAEPRANRLQMLGGMLGVSISWLLTGAGDGVGTPDAEGRRLPAAAGADALAELARLRAQVADVAADLGRLEARLRKLVAEVSE